MLFHQLHLHWSRTYLNPIKEEAVRIKFIETSISFSLGRRFKYKWTNILTIAKRPLRFFKGAKGVYSIFVFCEFFGGLWMKLLMLNNSILQYSQMLIIIFGKSNLPFFLQRVLNVFMMNIFIFNFYDILFVLVDYAKQLALNFGEMLPYLVFVEEGYFLFND